MRCSILQDLLNKLSSLSVAWPLPSTHPSSGTCPVTRPSSPCPPPPGSGNRRSAALLEGYRTPCWKAAGSDKTRCLPYVVRYDLEQWLIL